MQKFLSRDNVIFLENARERIKKRGEAKNSASAKIKKIGLT